MNPDMDKYEMAHRVFTAGMTRAKQSYDRSICELNIRCGKIASGESPSLMSAKENTFNDLMNVLNRYLLHDRMDVLEMLLRVAITDLEVEMERKKNDSLSKT